MASTWPDLGTDQRASPQEENQQGDRRRNGSRPPGPQILQSQYVVALSSKYTRALTFENLCQGLLRGAPQGAADVEDVEAGGKLKGLFGRLFANKDKNKEDHNHAQEDAASAAADDDEALGKEVETEQDIVETVQEFFPTLLRQTF